MAQALEDQDRNNDILRTLFLKHCGPINSNNCSNKDKTIVDHFPSTGSSTADDGTPQFKFTFATGKLECDPNTTWTNTFNPYSSPIATIADTNKHLLLALS